MAQRKAKSEQRMQPAQKFLTGKQIRSVLRKEWGLTGRYEIEVTPSGYDGPSFYTTVDKLAK